MNIDDLDVNHKELTAFAQQQMMDLAPHIDGDSPVDMEFKHSNDGFLVEMTAEHGTGRIQTVAAGPDIFSAIRNAKDGLLDYFIELESELNPELRNQRINRILSEPSLRLH